VFSFDLAILDWKMPDLDGLAVLQKLRALAPETSVLLISVAAADQQWVEAACFSGLHPMPLWGRRAA